MCLLEGTRRRRWWRARVRMAAATIRGGWGADAPKAKIPTKKKKKRVAPRRRRSAAECPPTNTP